MKILIFRLFFFVFVNQLLVAQTNTYYVKYEFSLENFEKRIISDPETKPFRDFFIDIINNNKNIEFELQIEGDKSYFRKVVQLSDSENTSDLVIISGLSYKGNWFTDINKRHFIMLREFQGKKYYVKKPIDSIGWTLSNESKNILGVKCYKATYKTKTTKGIDYVVTAWFAKSIPLHFGPTDYGGNLPGLILELHDMTSIYRATEIKNLKKFNIVWPNEKDIMTEEAYKKQGDKITDFYKKMN